MFTYLLSKYIYLQLSGCMFMQKVEQAEPLSNFRAFSSLPPNTYTLAVMLTPLPQPRNATNFFFPLNLPILDISC